MDMTFTLGNAISIVMAVAMGVGVLVRMRMEQTAMQIKHDAEIKALEKDITDLKNDQREMDETTKRIFELISGMNEKLGNAFQELRDRLTRIEAQRSQGQARRGQ